MKQSELNNYFSTKWQSNLAQYQYSGWSLIDKIRANESVLDVGCGFNEFKPRISNLTGLDPANDCADVKLPIEEYSPPHKFDVAFCLGSINFGGEAIILNQIDHVVKLLKPKSRIYWRCNPGLADHGNEECKEIDFYPWSIDKHVRLSEQFGFRLVTCCWDNDRIYAEWSRSA